VWGKPANVDVAVAAEVTTFFERFIDRLSRVVAERRAAQ
jgi:hypothetical protein